MTPSISKIREALSFIPPDLPRLEWVRIGMAVKSELGDEGFDLWDTWSRGAESYQIASAKSTWKSIKASGGIGIGTLFHEAALNGWHDSDKHQEPSPQEIEARQRAKAAREVQALAEQRRIAAGHKRAAARAGEVIKGCKPGTHNYLRSKQLPDAIGLVNAENELVVPMRSLDTNELVGAQVIRWLMEPREWEKKMLPGMRAKGAVLRLGPRQSGECWLVEGYATGLSVEAALRRLSVKASVLVCFSAHNLVHVASGVSGRRFVFADHDASSAGQRAAKDTGLPFCMSPVLGEDANDMHARAGLMAVSKLMMEARHM